MITIPKVRTVAEMKLLSDDPIATVATVGLKRNVSANHHSTRRKKTCRLNQE